MNKTLGAWWQRKFGNPEALVLISLLVGISVVIYWFGRILAPILVAVVLAYLLDWVVEALEGKGMPRHMAVMVVFVSFLAFLIWLVLVLLPLVWSQVEALSTEWPQWVQRGQLWIKNLPKDYPGIFTPELVADLSRQMGGQLGELGRLIVSISLSSILNLAAIAVYMILVPLMVFFFLKDKHQILDWISKHLPRNRALAVRVWQEVDMQIGNYVRGKISEILIVGSTSYFAFALLGLNYALLLGVLVGLSVLIPYIGAAVVTVPVLVVGYLQWGGSSQFIILTVVYLVIQALDGNVLVPILFSEAVSLHPVAIIAAVLLFGGLWGFWGVFFAIPLATLVKAIINALEDGQVMEDEPLPDAAKQ
ncbi:MAG: AI-2E family transporter [Gammaproteobacteria bacterium]|nr:MAG: AI-2E family transporter [Gammaproteobacteria bacterium]